MGSPSPAYKTEYDTLYVRKSDTTTLEVHIDSQHVVFDKRLIVPSTYKPMDSLHFYFKGKENKGTAQSFDVTFFKQHPDSVVMRVIWAGVSHYSSKEVFGRRIK